MRIGQNPSKVKGSPAYKSARIGIASLTYVPALEGYFRESLDVIGMHLESLRLSTNDDCNLFVFDNGSCPEVLDFLSQQWRLGKIDWLFLSHHNLGKNGALNWILGSLPNEYIVYSDSDVFFRKGWLEGSLNIFESFDQAGMVSAQPVLFDFLKGEGRTAKEIASRPEFQIAQVQPDLDFVVEYCNGINASPEQRAMFRQQKLAVAHNTLTGMRAVISATDMQFMLRRDTARKLVPLPIAGALTGKDAIEIPRGIEALGGWLLSTETPLVWHIGNSIGGRLILETKQIQSASLRHRSDGINLPSDVGQMISLKKKLKYHLARWIRRTPWLMHSIERLYGGLFGLLYEELQPGKRKP
jgi:hypothetical protein